MLCQCGRHPYHAAGRRIVAGRGGCSVAEGRHGYADDGRVVTASLSKLVGPPVAEDGAELRAVYLLR